jgi:hypothetical protein
MNTERPTPDSQHPGANPADAAAAGRHQYKVRIGHTEVIVPGSDASDAVRNARRQLAGVFPRLWDVLYRMSDEEFRVEEVR